MSARRWTAIVAAALLVALCVFFGWLLRTESGAQWAANRAVSFMDGKLTIGSLQGTLVTPLSVADVRYRDAEKGVDVAVKSASVHLVFRELLSWRAHVLDAKVAGVYVALSEPTKPPDENNEPFTLKPPIDIVIDRFTLEGAKVSKDGELLFEATKGLLIAGWTSKGVGIEQLNVVSPQGRVDLKGTVAQKKTFNGEASGTFTWKQGDYQYAGALKLSSDSGLAKLDAHLTSPLDARLTGTARQEKAVPWTFALHVPTFDPRRELLPDSSIESLMVALKGEGDREHAHVSGEVDLNGAKVFVDPIQVSLKDQILQIEKLALRDAQRRGVLSVAGNVRFDKEPFLADLGMSWQDVEVPEKVAGQKLQTHGELQARGNLQQFDTHGDVAIGPPGRLASIKLEANGTPEAIVLKTFSIVQKQGNLTASGNIGLKPRVAWNIGAQARQFDPGALLAEWPGKLGFDLKTRGEILDAGPSATLTLDSLAGTLRQRQIAGNADLKLNPNKSVAGTLNLKSGRSTIKVVGTGGESLDLAADFDVASMEDWLPESQGKVNGHVTVKGEWPKVAVNGSVKGQGLLYQKISVRQVGIEANVQEPQHPHGSVKVNATEVEGPDFELASVDFEAQGNEEDHTAHLKATGDPVSTEVNVKGKRLPDGWQGTVDALKVAVTNIEPLALRQPVQVRVAGTTFDVSEACLANSEVSACASAQQNEAGELLAHYAIERLPLAFIVSLTQPNLGYVARGTIEGKGDIRRTPQGALFGNATLSSASGSVAEEGQESDPLLKYENFQLAAELNGETAHGTTRMAFNDGGLIEGELSVGALSSAAPTLDGHGKLNISDLSPIGLFVPQLADVKGSASGEAKVTGTMVEPNISGSALAKDFAAELPVLGLKLKEGQFKVEMSGAGAIQLQGVITSGEGQLIVEGGGPKITDFNLSLTGKNVTAADIPAADVIVEPDLKLARRDERMDLTGKISVISAEIDLTKLPKGSNVTQASSDVVVVDDPAPEAKAAKAMQLHTHITVVLGEGLRARELQDVKLTGFGLDARLGGELEVDEAPGGDPLGTGTIRLEGKYKAYGQDLTIQSGRLLYANTPLSDPQLDIIAIRVVDDVTAKLTVTGNAQGPILNVSADPSMPQTAALSYLVTGKPLDQVGSGEGDLVQSAARSLGGAAGNFLAKNIGKRIGIDEIGVDNSTELGGSAFTVGQYLSPRLYISYGVGIFEPGQVVTLRYRISRKFNMEASQGPKSQRAGVNYRQEK